MAALGLSTNQMLEFGEGPDAQSLRVLFIHDRREEAALFDVRDLSALPIWMPFAEIASSLVEGRARSMRQDAFLPRLVPDSDLTRAAIETRDRRLEIIRPLALAVEDGDMPILRVARRGAMISEAVARHGAGKAKIYLWLRFWWRFGQLDNALLPSFDKCGTGERRHVSKKLGRPLSTSKLGPEHVGMNVDDATRRLLIRGAKLFWSAKPGEGRRTKRQAYQETLQAFFYKRVELKDGVLTPVIREGVDDDNRLPTFEQWDYAVERDLEREGALVARYDEREMALRRRPVLDSSQHLSKGPGELFLIDATVGDLYLVSSYDRAWTVGRPILYLVVDHYSRMIVGLHVGLEGPNWTGAMMALANTFSDKVVFCRRFGVEISQEDWPCDVAPAQLTADRGEVLSQHADFVVPGFNMVVHNTQAFRADFKSFVEGQFKITNERGIKRIPGWVDKLKERGGPDYRLDAVLDLRQFTRVMIELALHNNRSRGLSSNIPQGFPLQDDEKPVPLELWNWGMANGSPSIRRFPEGVVRRNLLPTFEAVTSRSGLSQFGKRLHYTSERAISEGWFMNAPTRGGRKFDIAIDPQDVSTAYIRVIGREMERCILTPKDERTFAGCSLADVEDYVDRQRRRDAAQGRKRIQPEADLAARIDAITATASEAKKDAIKAAGRAKLGTTHIRERREMEREAMRIEDAHGQPPLAVAHAPKPAQEDEGHVHMPD